jgi:hypothetical protein
MIMRSRAKCVSWHCFQEEVVTHDDDSGPARVRMEGLMSGYLDYSGRDDVLSGGVRKIPVDTPAGRFQV